MLFVMYDDVTTVDAERMVMMSNGDTCRNAISARFRDGHRMPATKTFIKFGRCGDELSQCMMILRYADKFDCRLGLLLTNEATIIYYYLPIHSLDKQTDSVHTRGMSVHCHVRLQPNNGDDDDDDDDDADDDTTPTISSHVHLNKHGRCRHRRRPCESNISFGKRIENDMMRRTI
ncbi:hypothetical protein BLOT_016665 [Blomia tropicalis]|nr:hypothetical protein BLOT_016665 [Blomia tropicalis]